MPTHTFTTFQNRDTGVIQNNAKNASKALEVSSIKWGIWLIKRPLSSGLEQGHLTSLRCHSVLNLFQTLHGTRIKYIYTMYQKTLPPQKTLNGTLQKRVPDQEGHMTATYVIHARVV